MFDLVWRFQNSDQNVVDRDRDGYLRPDQCLDHLTVIKKKDLSPGFEALSITKRQVVQTCGSGLTWLTGYRVEYDKLRVYLCPIIIQQLPRCGTSSETRHFLKFFHIKKMLTTCTFTWLTGCRVEYDKLRVYLCPNINIYLVVGRAWGQGALCKFCTFGKKNAHNFHF